MYLMMKEQSQMQSYSKTYDELYSLGYHSDPDYSHSYGVIELMFRELEFDTVLDVGASVGAAVSAINARGKQALGLEASLVAVNKAKQIDPLKRPVLWGKATKLPFPSKDFDIVMSTDVFEHLKPEDVEQAIAECQRVARKYIVMKIASLPEQAGWGKKVGVDDLHLTQQPIFWWKDKFLRMGDEIVFENKDSFVIKLRKEECTYTTPETSS